MAKATKSAHLIDLAKRGAEVRARFLADELRLLFSAFPHLHDAFGPDDLPVPFLIKAGAENRASVAPARRKRMSAAARKAVGERMRQYWAARKAAGDK